jgi:DNA-directed RNA polymerase specialized sigma24 family protein
MVEAKQEVQRAEFDAISRRLQARAKGGRGDIRRIPSADAEDVVQDAWEKTVKQKRGIPNHDELEAHVHRALIDTSTDYWRTKRLKRQIPAKALQTLDARTEETVASPESDERILAAMRVAEISAVLGEHLDPLAARYAVLDALEFTEQEIAEALDVDEADVGAIRKRVSRARQAIAGAINHEMTSKEEI